VEPMNDSEIEDFLRRYRPVAPPARLRERIFSRAGSHRIWPWASAAAVLLIAAIAVQTAAEYEVARTDVKLGPAAAVRVAQDLTEMLGGDLAARELADFILVEQQIRTEVSMHIPTGPNAVPGEEVR
jgi:hypothetical protein